jgi:AhpD family alkylhydroperoxidase
MAAIERQVTKFNLRPKLRELIKIRVSQINESGSFLNLHTKGAGKLGKTEQRLNTLAAWWEVLFLLKLSRLILNWLKKSC